MRKIRNDAPEIKGEKLEGRGKYDQPWDIPVLARMKNLFLEITRQIPIGMERAPR